eukprot:TRINITY_DN6548_c0_g1_i1.p1 TRINITY_DN6548_c0_g1~~TRINITY_DN6548_c0_g1_i1.p1  ORF type:complete len:292 (-),score=40.38 TRINITY_DN6548_c0_g1_i1:13-888(-)
MLASASKMGKMWRALLFAATLIEPACSKGSSSYGSYSYGGSYGTSSYRSAAMYGVGGAAVGAYAAVVLTSSGSRRRYGSYVQGDGACRMASTEIITASCSNLMHNEDECWQCIDCKTTYCQGSIHNCEHFLAEMYTECCEDVSIGCDGGDDYSISVGGAIAIAIVLCCVCIPYCVCLCFCVPCPMKQEQNQNQVIEGPPEEMMAYPPTVGGGATYVQPFQGGTFAVQVPEGATSGTSLLINSPQGQQMNVVVPPGVMPGQTFQVQAPVQAPVQASAVTVGQPVEFSNNEKA